MNTLKNIRYTFFIIYILICAVICTSILCRKKDPLISTAKKQAETFIPKKSFEVLIPTFLGNNRRNFYGVGPVPQELSIIWKVKLGGDSTKIGTKTTKWYGTGWTGQPVLASDNDQEYLVFGSLNHKLYKVDAESGNIIWTYKFDDAIKGTATLMETEDDIIILQGSRMGFRNKMNDSLIPSLRAISFKTGKELWRFNIPRTRSYSRDVDGSALIYDNKVIIGAENGLLYVIDPLKIESR